MITKYNIKKLLFKLGFSENSRIFSKYIPDVDVYLHVDFNRQVFIYPEDKGLKIIEKQVCNLDLEDNLVIFECIHRLLEKGYKPHCIEIKSLSISNNNNNPIILVKNNECESFLIIDCKTWGKKFINTWKAIQDGNSYFFNYIHKERNVKYFCLYTSGFENDELKYISYIISVFDNDLILSEGEDTKPLNYYEDDSSKELYKFRRHTYEYNYSTRGIFEPDVQPYQIQIVKSKYTLNNLRSIQEEEEIYSKYNEFYNIMSKYNVSGRENAFDKLINLFICKIADEKLNQNDLQFYWKGNVFDSYFHLFDRLQLLYQKGMKEFFNEEVVYIDKDTLLDSFKISNQDINAIKNKILEYFHFQKYFSNNNFNFFDVHNEKTFYKNFEVLSKVVEIFQDIRLTSDRHSQIMGDMFEFFLEKGPKQANGQFFTPLPIVRFITFSLPIKTLFSDEQNPPKVIDYACGVGHFLTELAHQLRIMWKNQDVSRFYQNFYGIEKEYLLAKAAKVSVCMYNYCEINIILADALIQHPNVPENNFNLLVANPPYSVKGFLETLPESERVRYSLVETINRKSYSTNNSIEVFFLERAKQLLAPNGLAAIIMPISILSNQSSVYVRAREILLQNFDIIALVKLDSGTFGKTDINTVTLFLRRKNDKPNYAEYYYNIVKSWFDSNTINDNLLDELQLLQAYCEHIDVPIQEYITLIKSNPSQTLLDIDIFKEYRRAFNVSSEIKKLQKQRSFQQKNSIEQQIELNKQFVQFIRTIEREKLYYFILAYTQPCPVIVVRSPQGTEEMKKFLGYEWSTAKGKEGIKYLRGSIENIETPLFDPKDRDNPEKINTLIRRNFEGQTISIPESLKPYVTVVRLVDLLDFSCTSFDKNISLVPPQNMVLNRNLYKYTVKRSGEIYDIVTGRTPPVKNLKYFTGNNPWVSISDMTKKYITETKEKITDEAIQVSNIKKIPKGTVLYSLKPAICKIAISGIDLYTNEAIAAFVPKTKELDSEYLYYFLESGLAVFEDNNTSVLDKSPNVKSLRQILIPVPPPEVQAQIVSECQAIDNTQLSDKEIEEKKKIIENNKEKIKFMLLNLEKNANNYFKMSDNSIFEVFIGKRVLKEEVKKEEDGLPVYSSNVYEPFGYTHKNLLNDFSVPSVLWGIDGDWMVRYMPANQPFYPTDHCGVIRVKKNNIFDLRYLAWKLHQEGKRIGFSRYYRASLERIKRLVIKAPTFKEQNKVFNDIEELENEIQSIQLIIAPKAERKRLVLKKYLWNHYKIKISPHSIILT